MERWWSDGHRAREVLACVDGSDVSQGVASAVLGLHALNVDAVAPLAAATLVDRATVSRRMRQVDLAPVADAVARATRTVMGDAASTYGVLVAKSWQDDAVESADKILARWTAQGLPWPTAIQRLTAVVGLPVSAAGSAVAKLQAPAVNDLVAKDYGDRALMRHARHVGDLEVTGAVAKMSATQRAEFEREHPRDRWGRFADKPDSPEAARQRREKRKDEVRSLRRRNAARAQQQSVTETPRQEVPWGLLGLLPKRQQNRQETQRQGPQRKVERAVTRSVRRSSQTQESDDTGYAVQPAYDKNSAFALDQESFVIMSMVDAVSLVAGAKDGQFNGAGLRDLVGYMPVAFDGAHVQNEINNLAKLVPGEDFVVLRLDGVASVDDTNYSVNLADSGQYTIDMSMADIDPTSLRLGMQIDSGFYMPTSGNPARATSQGKPVPMINAYLSNFSEFPTQTRNLPYDRSDRFDFDKALSGFELEEFNRLHPRDEEGQFAGRATRPAAPTDVAARERRLRRRDAVRDRRRRIQERQVASQVQAQVEQQAQSAQRAPVKERGERQRPARQQPRREFRRSGPSRQLARQVSRSALVTEGRDQQQRFDFARATGWVMSNQAFVDIAGLDIDNQYVGDDFGGVGLRPSELVSDMPMVPGQEALRRLATAWRKGIDVRGTVRVDGGPYRNQMVAEERALEFVNTMDMADYDEDLVPRAYAEAREARDGGVEWYPRVALTHDNSLSEQVVIFGSDAAMRGMVEYGSDIDPNRLVLIHSGPLDGLLRLRADDASIAALPLNEPRSNGFVRAFWYQDEG